MKKLTKKHVTELEALKEKLTDAAIAFNEARTALDDFRDERLTEMDAWSEERSDNWHDTENGELHQTWRDAWGEEPCDEAPEDFAEFPTDMMET